MQFCSRLSKTGTLEQIFDLLDLPKLSPSDYLFMTELLQTLKPVATTLDHLQAGKEKSALGFLIPRIYELNDRLTTELQNNRLVYCKPLLECLSKQLHKRYGKLMEVNLTDETVKECALPTSSHPKFRLQWCPDIEVEEKVKQLAVAYVEKNQLLPVPAESCEPDSEFQFIAKRQRPSAPANSGLAQLQLMQYFADKRGDIECLQSYVVVKKMFCR